LDARTASSLDVALCGKQKRSKKEINRKEKREKKTGPREVGRGGSKGLLGVDLLGEKTSSIATAPTSLKSLHPILIMVRDSEPNCQRINQQT
jgi:hypothetical protein